MTTSAEHTMTKQAVIYLRVSTAGQAERGGTEEGFSIPAQRDACLRTAERLNAMVVEEYVDRGESARSADRPQLQAMLARIARDRDIDLVIVHKVDRLARSRQDDIEIVVAIRQAGAQLVSATENIDETPSGKLLHGIMATIAEFYSQNLANEVIKGMRQKAKLGGTPHRPPIGYVSVFERRDGKTVRSIGIDPERAPHIRWMFEAYATGDYLIRELAEALAERGLRTPLIGKRGGVAMSVSQVEKSLANPYYIGIVTFQGVQYPGKHEPLISGDLWEAVQAIKESRRHSKEKPYEHPHYLKGTVFCGACGTRLGVTKIRKASGQEYDYFYCIGRQKKRTPCGQKYIPMDRVETKIEELWDRIRLPGEQIAAIRSTVLEFVRDRGHSEAAARESQTRRLGELQDERGKLMTAYYAGAVPVEMLKTEQDRIGSEIRRAQALLANAELELAEVERGLDNLLELVADAGRLYRAAPSAIRRQFNQAIFTRLLVDENGLRGGDLRSPFQEIVGVPTMEQVEIESQPYFRPANRAALPGTIERSLRQVFGNANGATISGRPVGDVSDSTLPEEAASSNVWVMVRAAGFEPATFGSGGQRSIH